MGECLVVRGCAVTIMLYLFFYINAQLAKTVERADAK